MKFLTIVFSSLLIFSTQLFSVTEEEKAYVVEVTKIWDSLNKQHGEIKLPNNVATLNVPEEFFYLNPTDAETLLTKIWGNPPSSTQNLGMLLPSGKTPMESNSWGVTIDYEEDGYVSDEDVDDIDYDDLLSDMQSSTEKASEARVKMGYEPITLVGWASKPYYDELTNKLYWAQEIKFGSQEVNTLNYNIRILGRKGVLILNFIAGMEQLDEINSQIDTVLKIAEFNTGSRYSDFNPDIDTVATYGVGALIAGKVAAKVGLFAVILLFLKKFWILLVLFGGGILKKITGK